MAQISITRFSLQLNLGCLVLGPVLKSPVPMVTVIQALYSTPNYNIHSTENITINISRYIWNVTVAHLDAFINHVSRYITVSEHISM